MKKLVSSAAANAAANALYEAMARLAAYVPGAYVRQGPAGTRLVFTTFPVPELNVVWVGQERDLGETAAFAKELSATGMPWSIQVRGEVSSPLKRLADQLGRTQISTQPLLVWETGPASTVTASGSPGATVRKVSTAEAEVYAAALAAGFGMPREIADVAATPAALDTPGITGFLLDLHGEAVATGTNVTVGDYAWMLNGAVPPQHRRNGYYRTLVTARLADAVASGARHAVTQTSPMSQPLFESLGFRLAETWTYLKPDRSS